MLETSRRLHRLREKWNFLSFPNEKTRVCPGMSVAEGGRLRKIREGDACNARFVPLGWTEGEEREGWGSYSGGVFGKCFEQSWRKRGWRAVLCADTP